MIIDWIAACSSFGNLYPFGAVGDLKPWIEFVQEQLIIMFIISPVGVIHQETECMMMAFLCDYK